jgi:hypothetical protein
MAGRVRVKVPVSMPAGTRAGRKVLGEVINEYDQARVNYSMNPQVRDYCGILQRYRVRRAEARPPLARAEGGR